jgi:rod shape determining protein RodA
MVLKIPWGLVAVTLAIALLGIWNLASASRPPHTSLWARQLLNLGVGVAAGVGVCLMDYRFIQRMAWPIYGANAAALMALKFIGHRAKGEASWFALGPLRVEPAEFMKLALIIALARFFHDDYREGEKPYGPVRLWKPVLLTLFAAGLVLPDLGNTMMILLTACTILVFSRLRLWVLGVGVAGLLAVSLIIWNDYVRDPSDGHRTVIRHVLKAKRQRIAGWLSPDSDLKGWGTTRRSRRSRSAPEACWEGLAAGDETGLFFLPEQHTDFIFSVWAEEHGFLACLLLLGLYGLIFAFALGVAMQARDRFGAFVAVGVAAMIFWQVFENIGMVVGLLPVTGITLPLMSYGGSSMMSILLSLGLLASIAMRRHMF